MSSNPMPIQGVSELALWTRDLETSIAFYRDRLCFEVDDVSAGHHAFLRSGSLVLGLFALESPGTKLADEYLSRTGGAPQGDVYHVGFMVNRAALDEFAQSLQEDGLELRGPVDFAGGRRSYFFEDPDAHTIELTDR